MSVNPDWFIALIKAQWKFETDSRTWQAYEF